MAFPARRIAGVMSLAVFAICIVALAACSGGRQHRGRRLGDTSPSPVQTTTAVATTVHPSVQIAGIIAPFQNVSLSSSLVEPTDSVNVIEGDYVRKGQVLAVLDTTDLRASYSAAVQSALSDDARTSQTKYQEIGRASCRERV